MNSPNREAEPPDPLVSVVVPNYNHRPFLAARLDSILAQTFTDYEILLLDDASSDGSVEFLQQYADRPNVRLLLNRTNSGSPFAQWNRGVEAASGRYVWIAESDDTAEPRFLETLVAALESHPDVGIAECMALRVDEHGQELGTIERDAYPESADRWYEDYVADGCSEIRDFLYLQNTIPSASAVVFRRSVYQQAGPADATFRISGDWWQWARMLALKGLSYHAEPLAGSRIHDSSQRHATADDNRYMLESLNVQTRIQQLISIPHDTIRKGARLFAVSWLQSVRGGRYSGPVLGHLQMLARLMQSDPRTALWFLVRLPYAMTAWILKRTVLRPDRIQS